MIVSVEVALEDVDPPVRRVIEVPADLRLDRLHLTLQAAMGWENAHLYAFEAGRDRWGTPGMLSLDHERPADRATLAEAVGDGRRRRLVYIYDFGDDWRHLLKVGTPAQAEPDRVYPCLVRAEGRCPPEDVGGPPDYEAFLDAMADPAHPEHAEMLDWHGGPFDPGQAPEDDLRRAVQRLARRWAPRKRKG